MAYTASQHRRDFDTIDKLLSSAPAIDKSLRIGIDEFRHRHEELISLLNKDAVDVGIVFSDEHYNGDVPYLGGNTNITVEQVAGVIGKTGFHLLAGLEGGYVAEQLAPRSGAKVHKVEILKLADEEYPVKAERLEDVIIEANGGKRPQKIGLLTPKQVIPAALVDYLMEVFGRSSVVDAQEIYYRFKNEKSDMEMKLISDASKIGCVMMEGMLRILKPGMLETQVAAWGYFIGYQLGAEEMGFDIMVGANQANRTLIGKALNREISEGDFVHLGVGPKRDGLSSCVRRSAIAVDKPSKVTPNQKFWFDLIEEAYQVGYESYLKVADGNLPARLQEQSLVDFFKSKSDLVSLKIGKKIELDTLKPYTGTHNAGYTECQEFYGAITLDSNQPLGHQIVTMLDVALRGIGDHWNDVRIPDFDYIVIENTLHKKGRHVVTLTDLPLNVQHLVGRGL